MEHAKAARELTTEEIAERYLSTQPPTVETLCDLLREAVERGKRQERSACSNLAWEHALTITEVTVAETPTGRKLSFQEQIDVAADLRHVAQYVGVLISNRTPSFSVRIES